MLLKSPSRLPKKIALFASVPLKIMKNVFLFHPKSSLRSQDIQIFVLTFWTCRENMIRKPNFLVNIQLQYTYCPISLEVKLTRQ